MASSTVQITGGAFQDVAGNALANGYLILSLSQDAQVNSQEVSAGVSIRVQLDGSGDVIASPAVYIWPNDVLTPTDTFYTISAYTADGQLVWGPNPQQIASTPSPFDIGAWIPGSVSTVAQVAGVSSFNTRAGAVVLESSDVTTALTYTPVNKAGDTMTGLLVLSANPTAELGAATKQYVDTSSGGNAITSLTGDVTASGPGAAAASLATVNSDAGTVGSSTAVPVITSDAKGRITATSTAALGTMAAQSSSDVAITGGTVDGTAVGAITPAAGAFTSLSSTNFNTFSAGSGSSTSTYLTTNGVTNPTCFGTVVSHQGAYLQNCYFNGTEWIYTGVSGFGFAGVRLVSTVANDADYSSGIEFVAGPSGTSGDVIEGMDSTNVVAVMLPGNLTFFNPGTTTLTVPADLTLAANPSLNFTVDTSGNVTAGTVTAAELATTQTATASSTASDHSIPININGTTRYMRLSSTP